MLIYISLKIKNFITISFFYYLYSTYLFVIICKKVEKDFLLEKPDTLTLL